MEIHIQISIKIFSLFHMNLLLWFNTLLYCDHSGDNIVVHWISNTQYIAKDLSWSLN